VGDGPVGQIAVNTQQERDTLKKQWVATCTLVGDGSVGKTAVTHSRNGIPTILLETQKKPNVKEWVTLKKQCVATCGCLSAGG
jgi:hypothetical protein